jgi:hypothetical protein
MTPVFETRLQEHGEAIAAHDVRITNVESTQKDHGKELRKILWGVISTLVMVVGELLFHAGKH